MFITKDPNKRPTKAVVQNHIGMLPTLPLEVERYGNVPITLFGCSSWDVTGTFSVLGGCSFENWWCIFTLFLPNELTSIIFPDTVLWFVVGGGACVAPCWPWHVHALPLGLFRQAWCVCMFATLSPCPSKQACTSCRSLSSQSKWSRLFLSLARLSLCMGVSKQSVVASFPQLLSFYSSLKRLPQGLLSPVTIMSV